MGRRQYLTRLALGRSAFQDQHGEFRAESGSSRDSAPIGDLRTDPYVQQYDTKGRPMNLTTEVRNAEMRRAQNSILALVGVVEERERREQSDELKFRHIRTARQATLKEENDVGHNMTVLPVLLGLPLEWWTDCLCKRCIIGLYYAQTPFADIVCDYWLDLRGRGLRGLYEGLFPGSVLSLVHHFARFLPGVALDHLIIGPLEQIALRDASRKARRRTMFRVSLLRQAVLLAIDLAVLPLLYYASAQHLGLAPAFPILPSAAIIVPWHKDSLHSFGWQSVVSIPFVRHLTSPAALLLINSMFWSDLEEEEESPVNPNLTSFRTPDVNVALDDIEEFSFRRDPLGWALGQAHRVRTKVLHWAGWSLTKRTTDGVEFEDNWLNDGASRTTERYRSSALAHLPATLLANKIDDFFQTLIALPFETVMLRVVALSYMTSNLPKTQIAISRASKLYTLPSIFAAMQLFDITSIIELGCYASKIGLCLALKMSMDAVIISRVCHFVRQQGVRNFDWGSRWCIGNIAYATPPSPLSVVSI